MPEMTSVPDAERPIGRFITEQVLPKWESMNSFSAIFRHARVVNLALGRQGVQARHMGGPNSAYLLNGKVVGGRYGAETTLVSDQAAEACSVKSLTRAYWELAGVPIARGERFSSADVDEARDFVSSASNPLVMKPDSGRHGSGVSFGVAGDDFSPRWDRAISANRVPGMGDGVLIDEFRDALCVRFYVVGGEIHAATLRVPLFVVGDGSSTVRQLLEGSFAHQQRNVWLRNSRPKISDQLLANSDWQLQDVPASGALHILNHDPSLPLGGIPYEVTPMISSDLRELASEAATAIPGLGAAGIDVLTPSLGSADRAVALDADSRALLHMHRHPAFGRYRFVGLAIARQLRLRADHWNRPAYSSASQSANSPDEA